MEKKKFRLNVIDWVIILIVVAGAAFGGYKYLSSRENTAAPVKSKYTLVLDNADIQDDTFSDGKIKIGDKVIEKTVNAHLGNITNIDSKPSRSTVATSDGEIKLATRPLSSYLTITVEGEGTFSSNGGLLINGTQYLCNRSYEIIISDSVFWLRIVEITKVENS